MAKKLCLLGVMVILTAAVVVFGVLFFVARADLGDTQTALDGKISELSEAKTGLLNTQGELAATTSQLADTNTALTNRTGELADAKDQLNDKTLALASTETELNRTYDQLDIAKSNLAAEQDKNFTLETSNNRLNNDLTTSKNEVTELNKNIDLYKETFGEVFAGVDPHYVVDDTQPPGWNEPGPFIASLRLFRIENNPDAVNPTYAQVVDFMKADTTDSFRYVADYYMCGNYAETVHNNAEAAGIRTAIVFIRHEHGPGHAINAFLTTDRGLVYIDSTGSSFQAGVSLDCVVKEMKISQEYKPTFLFPSIYTIIYEHNNPITDIEVYW